MINLDECESVEKRYEAWVNNKVQALSLTVQRNQPGDVRTLLKHEFFLEEIQHHFMDCYAGYRIWRAFWYLKLYLRTYPHVKISRQKTAMGMLRMIYERLGISDNKISEGCV